MVAKICWAPGPPKGVEWPNELCLNDRGTPQGLVPLVGKGVVSYIHVANGVAYSPDEGRADDGGEDVADHAKEDGFVVNESLKAGEAATSKYVGVCHTTSPAHFSRTQRSCFSYTRQQSTWPSNSGSR